MLKLKTLQSIGENEYGNTFFEALHDHFEAQFL